MQKTENNSPHDEKPKWPKPKVGGNLRHKFSKQEDETLKRIVQQHGEGNWSVIASCMKNRTARQCRERYKNYLSPNIKNDPWTQEEEILLEKKYAELGPRWAKIALFFESRSDVNVKNHWTAMMNRQSREKLLNQERMDVRQKYESPLVPMIPLYPANAMIAIPHATIYHQVPMQQIQTIPINTYGQMAPIGIPHTLYQYPPNMFPQNAVQPTMQPPISQYNGVNVGTNSINFQPNQNHLNYIDSSIQTENPIKTEEIQIKDELQDSSDGISDIDPSFKYDTSFDASFDLFDF
ncbi:Myb-like DNA-binding domain containing protein [Histomonas meleagridis]|uniref:Myb-like DNA-binding domain containing protein n=1 Tax=Histomonas meleagridis TaxID=135588 RepID=UPI003559CD1D|nr:Myb-like DNA-binding domain containing protein [Histomonas meleagridis]KAH0804507.1 Myb-like DNA-binding domain containing protein [Histomonas meleagridis]